MSAYTSRTGRPNDTRLITQGEFEVSNEPDVVISTLLGSCVSCCLWDDEAGVGGMNHLLLAGERVGSLSGYDVAGVAEMECLINGIIKLGGNRTNLKAKVFGGANMLGMPTKIGEANATFAFDFLKQENIDCVNSSVGGSLARSLRFWPTSGRANLRFATDAPLEQETPSEVLKSGNELELF